MNKAEGKVEYMGHAKMRKKEVERGIKEWVHELRLRRKMVRTDIDWSIQERKWLQWDQWEKNYRNEVKQYRSKQSKRM